MTLFPDLLPTPTKAAPVQPLLPWGKGLANTPGAVALAGRVPMAPAVLVVQAALLALVVRAVQINSVVVVVVVQKALLAHRQVALVAYQVALVVVAQPMVRRHLAARALVVRLSLHTHQVAGQIIILPPPKVFFH